MMPRVDKAGPPPGAALGVTRTPCKILIVVQVVVLTGVRFPIVCVRCVEPALVASGEQAGENRATDADTHRIFLCPSLRHARRRALRK